MAITVVVSVREVMRLVVKLLGLIVLCAPVFAYAINEDILGSVEMSILTIESVWHTVEMYGSMVLIVVGLVSLIVARKRQKTLSS